MITLTDTEAQNLIRQHVPMVPMPKGLEGRLKTVVLSEVQNTLCKPRKGQWRRLWASVRAIRRECVP